MLHTHTRLLQTQLLKGDGDPTGQSDKTGQVNNYFHQVKVHNVDKLSHMNLANIYFHFLNGR